MIKSSQVVVDDLTEVDEHREANYVRIDKLRFPGCKVTEGEYYELKRSYSNAELFENGEIYIVDDEGRDNYSIFMVCKTTLFK